MEDVYHYTRSPAWEELVSKNPTLETLFVSLRFSFYYESAQFPQRPKTIRRLILLYYCVYEFVLTVSFTSEVFQFLCVPLLFSFLLP